jgi:pyruvate formate lyase activating enzyme
MKEAMFYRAFEDGKVECGLCGHQCVIKPGRFGRCRVRENRDGKLFSMVYGRISAEQIDPVEKKPLFHFLPGTLTYSLATVGCNFTCLHCQNHSLSQVGAGGDRFSHVRRSPQEVVETALARECRSISYTYVEPTVFFEFALDCCLQARANSLKNIFVSNGFMSRAAAEKIAGVLDGINIDIKAFQNSFYKKVCGADGGLERVRDNVSYFHLTGVWVEVTTLLIPGLNDSDEEISRIAEFIAGIDPDICWHVSAFRPSFKMLDRPSTGFERLKRAREIGQGVGLRHVYVGNIHSGDGEDTMCPGCGQILIQRIGFRVIESRLKDGTCPFCGVSIAGVW